MKEAEPTLISQALTAFREHFDGDPTYGAEAPGRVNLIGEHTDYNDGFVLPMAIERRTVILAAPNYSQRFRIVALTLDEEQASFLNEDQFTPSRTTWVNYIKGVMAQFQKAGHRLPPLDMVVASDVPLGGGLSSSAALEVATASLLEQALGFRLDPPEKKALWCQTAEHEFAGVPCGIMDQFISVMAQKDHALLIDCRSQKGEAVPLIDPDVTVLITNSNVKHELTGGEYAQRRRECETAVTAIRKRRPDILALRDATMYDLIAAYRDDHAISETVFHRARHVIAENERTERAADALRRNAYGEFGRLMVESHVSLRDDYEVSVGELDYLVDLAYNCGGVYGSRMTGGGFGGCTVSLVHTHAVDDVIAHLEKFYVAEFGIRPTCFVTRPARGTRQLTIENA